MRIEGIIWLEAIVDKLERKHRVSTDEVEEVLVAQRQFYFVERGYRAGENVYAALGRTRAGRSLLVFFVYKARTKDALIVSARAASRRERKHYEKK